MVLGGVFDAHPALQIVVGHMGESLPSILSRGEERDGTRLISAQ
jgi:predicted TIM-barrel fold metal-dependent hydrolase